MKRRNFLKFLSVLPFGRVLVPEEKSPHEKASDAISDWAHQVKPHVCDFPHGAPYKPNDFNLCNPVHGVVVSITPLKPCPYCGKTFYD